MTSNRQSGVALLQALLLTMIVSLLALQLSLTAREQVRTAQMLEERIEADLLAHSLQAEALFNLFTMEDLAPTFVGRWQKTAERRAGTQRLVLNNGINVVVSDLSSRLPLRFPEHPLWQVTLEQAGMPRTMAEEFLVTLRDVQDEDEVNAAMGVEAATTGIGVPYPNRSIQLPTELQRWMGDWSGWMPLIMQISHHYPLFEVNNTALSATLRNASLNNPSPQQPPFAAARSDTSPGISLSSNELISRGSSSFWRIEVIVDGNVLSRHVQSDFLLQSLQEPPFLWIGN